MKWLLWQRMVGRVCCAGHDVHIHGACQLCQAHVHVPAKTQQLSRAGTALLHAHKTTSQKMRYTRRCQISFTK